MSDAQDNVVSMPPTESVRWADSYVNLLAGLGMPGRDKFTAQNYTFTPLSILELEQAYRGDWIARKAVDVPAFDMTREWRGWQADPDQIQLLEATEKKLLLQQKVQQALIKARLYGGAAIIIGVDAGDPEEELNYDDVTKDSLKFLHVVSRNQISMGPVIYDIASRYYGQPEYYEAQNRPVDRSFQTNDPADPNFSKTQVRLHPSRVIKLIGMDTADQLLNTVWGDSVLQAVNDAVKMCGLVSGSLATLVAEMKVDIISVPELKSILSTKEGERKMIARFQAANAAKSIINTVLIDGNEKWQRVEANLTAAPQVLSTYLQIASGAVDIPAGRFLGLPHRGLNVTGEADFRNYYDRLSSEQTVTLTPAMTALDEVLIRSALGTRPPEVWYEWNSLWQLSDGDKADIALKKAQAYQIDVNAAQLPPVALANGRANQLIEDGVYPGLEKALDDAAMEGDTIEEQNTPQPAPVGTLFGPGQHTAPFDPNAPPPAAPAAPPSNVSPFPPKPGQTGQLPPNARKSTFPGGKGAGDSIYDGGPGSGPHVGVSHPHAGRAGGKADIKSRIGDFVNSSEARDAIKSAASKTLGAVKQHHMEIIATAVTGALYHGVGLDFPHEVEAAIHNEISNLSNNLNVAHAMGHKIMKDTVAKLKSMRGIKDALGEEPDDELDQLLILLSQTLDRLEQKYKTGEPIGVDDFNPNHGERGRFSSGPGGGSSSKSAMPAKFVGPAGAVGAAKAKEPDKAAEAKAAKEKADKAKADAAKAKEQARADKAAAAAKDKADRAEAKAQAAEAKAADKDLKQDEKQDAQDEAKQARDEAKQAHAEAQAKDKAAKAESKAQAAEKKADAKNASAKDKADAKQARQDAQAAKQDAAKAEKAAGGSAGQAAGGSKSAGKESSSSKGGGAGGGKAPKGGKGKGGKAPKAAKAKAPKKAPKAKAAKVVKAPKAAKPKKGKVIKAKGAPLTKLQRKSRLGRE